MQIYGLSMSLAEEVWYIICISNRAEDTPFISVWSLGRMTLDERLGLWTSCKWSEAAECESKVSQNIDRNTLNNRRMAFRDSFRCLFPKKWVIQLKQIYNWHFLRIYMQIRNDCNNNKIFSMLDFFHICTSIDTIMKYKYKCDHVDLVVNLKFFA